MITKRKKIILITAFCLILLTIFWQSVFITIQQKVYRFLYKSKNSETLIPLTQRGTTEDFFIESQALNKKMEVRLYLPKQYKDNPKKKFPVLYLLHGDPGNSQDWLINADIQTDLDTLILSKKLKPLIVVFPDGNGPKSSSTQYVNATTFNQRMEDYVTTELVNEIDNHYRTLKTREGRSIGGNSSGGFGAINLGLRHNNLYSTLLIFGGYFDNWRGELSSVLGNNPKNLQENSPMEYISNLELNLDTHIYLTLGLRDWGSAIEENKKFSNLLSKKHIDHELVFTNGIHNWSEWHKDIPSTLLYLDKHLPDQDH